MIRNFALFTLLFCVCLPVQADVVKPALIEISVYRSGEFRIELRASIEALLSGINGQYRDTTEAPTSALYDELRRLPPEQLGQRFAEFEASFLQSVKLSTEQKTLKLGIDQVKIPAVGYPKVPRISVIEITGGISPSATELVWYYPLKFGDHATRVRQVDEAQQKWHWSDWQWIREDRPTEPYSLTEVFTHKPWYSKGFGYGEAGFLHIVPRGMDHILFILGLFLFRNRFKPLLWQATMFTLAHSLTLSFAMLGWIELPARVVEPLIALSIAYVGLENLWHHKLRVSRLALVFGFGLLHGLGFASVLNEFHLEPGDFALALISFNVGVEFGQISLLLLAWLAVWPWYKNSEIFKRYFQWPGSALIGLLGLIWTVQRLMA